VQNGSHFNGSVVDAPFCFLLEKSHRSETPRHLCSCLTPFNIQHSLLFLAFSSHLDKYSTVELSQLETYRFSYFSCFAVHSSVCQVFAIYFRVKSSKNALAFISLYKTVMVILKNNFKIKLSIM